MRYRLRAAVLTYMCQDGKGKGAGRLLPVCGPFLIVRDGRYATYDQRVILLFNKRGQHAMLSHCNSIFGAHTRNVQWSSERRMQLPCNDWRKNDVGSGRSRRALLCKPQPVGRTGDGARVLFQRRTHLPESSILLTRIDFCCIHDVAWLRSLERGDAPHEESHTRLKMARSVLDLLEGIFREFQDADIPHMLMGRKRSTLIQSGPIHLLAQIAEMGTNSIMRAALFVYDLGR